MSPLPHRVTVQGGLSVGGIQGLYKEQRCFSIPHATYSLMASSSSLDEESP